MDEARSILNKLLIAQEHERKETREQMTKEARHLHNFQASYQRLVDNFKKPKVVTKNAEQVITTARVTIAKAQALIQVNEQKLAAARERLEELEAAKKLVQEDLTAYSFKLESLQAQLATKRFVSEEELRVQDWAKVEKARQREMLRLQDRIYSLAEQD